jgi:hypothetical protein
MLGHLVYSRHAVEATIPPPAPAGWMRRWLRNLFRRH